MNYLLTVVALCTSFASYRPVRDLPARASILFLAKLAVLLALVACAGFIPLALERTDDIAQWVDEHFPAFSIQDGRVTTTVKQPCIAGTDQFRVILDTTGQVTEPDTNAPQGILFQADSVTVWMKATNAPEAAVRSRSQTLRGFPDGPFNGAYFRRLIRLSLWAALPFLWPALTLLGLLTALLQAYFFSVISSLMERGLPGRLQLNQLLNIAIHAVTPGAIIVTAYAAMRLPGLDLWLVYLIAYGVFLVGATNACRDVSHSNQATE